MSQYHKKRESNWRNKTRHYLDARDNGICGICHKPVNVWKAHIEHKIPASKGGSDNDGNLQLAHPYCNKRKGIK